MKNDSVDIQEICNVHARLVKHLSTDLRPVIETMVDEITRCLSDGGTVFTCGNGGSASQAEHFAGELLGRFTQDRDALPVHVLSQNTTALTAIANDYSYKDVFSRQLKGFGRKGDCLVALSTSGYSENIVDACRAAKQKGMMAFALTGLGGGNVAAESDITLEIPESETARVQEIHLIALHIICQSVEERIFSPDIKKQK